MAFIPAVLLTVGLVIVSLWEQPNVPQTVALHDKIVHGLMYMLLAVSWIVPIRKSKISYYAFVCVGITLFGALLELLQHYCTITRTGEWLDVLADFFGALLGVILGVLITSLRHYEKSSIINHQS